MERKEYLQIIHGLTEIIKNQESDIFLLDYHVENLKKRIEAAENKRSE